MRLESDTTSARLAQRDLATSSPQFFGLGCTTKAPRILVDIKGDVGGVAMYMFDIEPTPPPGQWLIRVAGATHEPLVEKELASWLPEALEELDEASTEAEEEGYKPVSELARANAEHLVSELAACVVQAPVVHSTPEGGIAIDFRNRERDAAVLIECEADGEAVCFDDIGDKRGRTRRSDASDILEAGGWSALKRAGLI